MAEWAPMLERYGVALVILGILAYFLIKQWWPYWKTRDEERESGRRGQMDRMLTLQEISMKEMVEAIKANTHQSETVVNQLNALTASTEAQTETIKDLAQEVRQRGSRR